MTPPTEAHDARYLEGIRHFNTGDYFEAHEVWEDLWHECDPADRRFYQGLIQAAVSLYHAGNGNWRGAHRLFHAAMTKLADYEPSYREMNVVGFRESLRLSMPWTSEYKEPVDPIMITERIPVILLARSSEADV